LRPFEEGLDEEDCVNGMFRIRSVNTGYKVRRNSRYK
jgi:hypothetical protein